MHLVPHSLKGGGYRLPLGGGICGAGSMKWSMSVCPVERQQLRCAVGLLLSAQ